MFLVLSHFFASNLGLLCRERYDGLHLERHCQDSTKNDRDCFTIKVLHIFSTGRHRNLGSFDFINYSAWTWRVWFALLRGMSMTADTDQYFVSGDYCN